MQDKKKILYDAISLWWLRPENGLALASYCINGINIKPLKSKTYLDFACGDGVNSFLSLVDDLILNLIYLKIRLILKKNFYLTNLTTIIQIINR